MLTAERDALDAEAKALQTLNQELQRHRATAEKSLAEVRALLSRREAALDEERSRSASLDQALVQARMELEVLAERRGLAPARPAATATSRKPKRPKQPATLSVSAKRRRRKKRASG
jgi:chromosome segregation ATPase